MARAGQEGSFVVVAIYQVGPTRLRETVGRPSTRFFLAPPGHVFSSPETFCPTNLFSILKSGSSSFYHLRISNQSQISVNQ